MSRRKLMATTKRGVAGLLRRALVAYAHRPARGAAQEPPTVTILLVSAWGMGGTIRASLNLAGYLAQHRRVEILSTFRRRETPFFGEFAPGVQVTALEDFRRSAYLTGLRGAAYRFLSALPSVLMHPADRAYKHSNLWTDLRTVRALRRRRGWVIATRPGLNFIAAELAHPGLIAIGQEQMHLDHHASRLKKAMPRLYPRLDAFVVLTEGHRERFTRHLGGQGRLEVIPNTVRPLPGPKADLAAKTVFTAGRLVDQKGFDLLLEAFAPIAADHPDWNLRICGRGERKAELAARIERLGLGGSVTLEPPATQIGEDMAAASIFALSSRFEGFPLILLEAMSKEMAVAAFDCPTGPADIVDDHRNGLLVPPKDVAAFRAALRELIEDEELRRRCGPAAGVTARQWTMEAIGPRWDALLDRLAAERGLPGAGTTPAAGAAGADGGAPYAVPTGGAAAGVR